MRAMTSSTTSKGGITVHLASAGERVRARRYDRLAWVASGVAAFTAARLLVWLLVMVFSGGEWRPGPANGVSALLLGATSLGMVVICRRVRPRVHWFAWIAGGYEVMTAALLGAALYGWQTLLSAAAIQHWIQNGREEPFGLGAGEVPWVGVLILVFGVAVPMKPMQQLFSGALASATLVAWVLLSLVMVPVPAGLETAIEKLTVPVLLAVVLPSLLCVGIGYMAARQIRQLSVRLQEAHELGSYRLIEKLGSGGMGEVWRAQHQMLARPAAIKLLRNIRTDPDDPRAATLLERFEREVQATSQLRSPHTVEVYDYGFTAEGVFYYVMELLDGTDLEDLIAASGPQPPARVIGILQQAASSLAEAHSLGLVHRDVKPANVMVCRVGLEEDFVKVLDFGLVKAVASGQEGPALTAEFSFAGTPAYAAPEVAKNGAIHATGQSDLYSLACVGYWLLTGQQVFPGGTPIQILSKHVSDRPPPPSQHLPAPLPDDLEGLIMRCLAKDPSARPAGAVGFLAELERCVVPEPWDQAAARAWWHRHGAMLRGIDPSEDTTI